VALPCAQEGLVLTPTIEQVIAAIPAWRGRDLAAARIAAGLTNENWRVVVDGVAHFVRIPGPATDLLAVDRANERHNTRAAAEAGVGPAVLHELPEWDVFVLAWVEARTMSIATLGEPGMPTRVAAALRQLHAGPRFRDDFDMFRLSERYLRVVDERAIAIPTGYRERMVRIPAIEAALAVHPLPSVPCHNDLLAENYLDDGERLWIVDYEYSGNGDPAFELGNTCQEQGWDEARIRELCAAYFGEATDALLARLRLHMIMSDVGWTLWAAIQADISTIEFDFFGWAEERWARAQAALDGPDLQDWLAAVRA
jgi:thiamine kinase-like enzyme